MIIVDRQLEARQKAGKPIQVALLGAGFLGRGLAYHIEKYVPGIRIAGVFSRRVDNAAAAYRAAGVTNIVPASNDAEMRDAIRASAHVVTDDASLLCRAEGIDLVIEATGSVTYGAEMALLAIRNRKHVLLNAELDGTVGPMLKVHADAAGVIISAIDGDQPGTELNVYRYVRASGFTPLMCGNIKALMDHYRTPITQLDFARKWKQNAVLCTSFADGSKISFEQAVVGNATGMGVAKRGMLGRRHDAHIESLPAVFDCDELKSWGGVVDYTIGSQPSPGVFVLATTEDKFERHYLNMYKLGEGPLYCFYSPYHLCHLEVPFAIARAVLHNDATAAPVGAPVVDVIALAKRKLRPGEKLDGIGGFTTYGECENSATVHAEGLLPIGMTDECEVIRPVERDQPLTYADVRLPARRVLDELRDEQDLRFFGARAAASSQREPVTVFAR